MATVDAPPSTPRATNVADADSSRHHPTSRRRSHGLAGEEVIELTTFAEKKAWIDEKIQFLSALPEIKASEPEPPASPAATSAELEAWWAEHGRIEREIDEYDMGDLARMRQLARDKSKHALSPRDTDLIEITLTTLFSVDKLLHLLRHRRRALTLLRHRLLWEETTETAWERYRAIVESDLPAFLRHALAASGPPPPADLLRSSQRSSLSTSTSSTDLGTSLRSLSASTSSRDLASSVGSSSTNRVQLSQLAYTTLTTNARTLSASLVPAAAASLDKLIDASPAPLPDSFLDAQDRLEEAVSALLGDGLDRFAAEVVRQFEMVVAMRAQLDRVQEESTSLVAAAASEAASTPTREMLAELLGRLEQIQIRADDVQDQLRDLPRPRHSAVPSQSEHTASLVAEIETRLSSCRKSLSETSAVVDSYRQKLDISTEVESLRREMQELSDRLEKIVAESGSSNGLPSCDLQMPDDDSRHGSPTRRLFAEHAAACESRASSLSTDLLRAQDLCKHAARLVNASRDVNLDAPIRQDLRRASDTLREKVAEGGRILEWETAHCERAVELSAWLLSLERLQALLAEAESRAREQLHLALWREGTAAVVDNDDGAAAARLMASIDAALADLNAKRQLVADQSRPTCTGPGALASLQERMDEVDERVRCLRIRHSLIDRAHEQARAIEAAVDSISSIRSRTFSVVSRVQRDGDLALPAEDEIDRIAQDFDQLRQNLHARVPFIAERPSSASSEVDLPSHDAIVRSVLNEMCISIAGLVDSSRQSVVNATTEPTRSNVHSAGRDEAQEVAPEVDAGDVPVDRDSGLEGPAIHLPPLSESPVRSEDQARHDLEPVATPAREAKSASDSDKAALKVADDLFSPETGLQGSAGRHRISNEWLAPLEEPAAVKSLRRRIRAIPTLGWLSPSTLRLPEDADVKEIVAETAGCTATLNGLLAESSAGNPSLLQTLRDELDALESATTRVQKLANFAMYTSQTDTAFSGLLDHIDAADLMADRKDETSDALSEAANAMTVLHRAAVECSDDPRVQRTLRRVESTYNELLDLLPSKTCPPVPARRLALPCATDGTTSTDGGEMWTSAREMERQGLKSPESSRSSSRASTARSSLSRSTTLRSGATTPTTTPWHQSYGSLSARNMVIDLKSSRSTVTRPFSFDRARSPAGPCKPEWMSPPSTHRRPAPASASKGTRPRNKDSASALRAVPSTPSRSRLTAKPTFGATPRDVTPRRGLSPARSAQSEDGRNKLDRAVNLVARAMPFVTIELAEGRWTDESGFYLIGERPCFCRLLRSKQVMVRVGGGWLELSQFILTHFGPDEKITLSPVSTLKRSSTAESLSPIRSRPSLSASTSSATNLASSGTSVTSENALAGSSSSVSQHPKPRYSFVVSTPLSPPAQHVWTSRPRDHVTTGSAKTPRAPVWRP